MEIHSHDGDDGPPEEIILAFMLISADFCTSAEQFDATSKPAPSQYALSPGDVGFLTKSDSTVDEGFTAVKLLDPETSPDQNWGDRIRNGFVFCDWTHVDDPTPPNPGWFSRAKIVPVANPLLFEELREDIKKTGTQFDTDVFPDLDPAYRALLAAQLPQNESDVEPLLCEQCSSTNMVVRIWHNTFLEASAAYKTENGERLLFKASTDHEDCTFEGEMECLDCHWSRTAEESEFHGKLAHHKAIL